jgi:hypothetical protein
MAVLHCTALGLVRGVDVLLPLRRWVEMLCVVVIASRQSQSGKRSQTIDESQGREFMPGPDQQY